MELKISKWFGIVKKIAGKYNLILTVNGDSMEPTLKPGQKITAINKSYLNRKIKEGDIIVFEKFDSHFTLHRIIEVFYDKEKKKLGYKTKGDNNSYIDKYVVYPEEILGIVLEDEE